MVLGKCPYCGGSVISQKLTIQGQKVNLYTCEHAKKSGTSTMTMCLVAMPHVVFEFIPILFYAGINEV